MAENTVLIELQLIQKGDKIALVQKETEKLGRSTDRLDKKRKKLTKTTDVYNRREKGTAQISSNSTKNFSKMQQSIDGGGGSGGLVRAYALLAANVFALSAAFGILSRSAQIDTLMESMKQLEIVSGQSVRAAARDLQVAAGFGLDMAESMRSVSLALSAGFQTDTINELGEVARNAAVSLGRNMPDALDRIFRGIIKVEPELLDEIGLFVRVNEASAKYASTLGIAAGDLTEFQKRQAFANEGIEQGTKKFAAFSEIETDPFSKLATSFADLSQEVLSFVNRALKPIVDTLAENKGLLAGVFAGIALSLLRLAVPAMGKFTQAIAVNAQEARENAEMQNDLLKDRAAKSQASAIAEKENNINLEKGKILAAKTSQSYQGRGKALKDANSQLNKAVTNEEKIAALSNKSAVLEKSRRKTNSAAIDEEQAAIAEEIRGRERVLQLEREIAAAKKDPASAIKPGSKADLDMQKAMRKEIKATGLANIAATAETQGFRAAMGSLTTQLNVAKTSAKTAGVSFGLMSQGLFLVSGAAVAAQAAITRLMMVLGPWLAAFALLSPLIGVIAKKMGFFSKEAEALKEASKAASEAMEVFGETFENAEKRIQGADFTAARQGSLALAKEIASTSKTLDDQATAVEEYAEKTNGIVFFLTTTLFRRVDHAFTKFNKKQEDQMKEFVKRLAESEATSLEILKLVEDVDIDNMSELREVIAEIAVLAPEIAAAQENLTSAIDGARDSARAFRDTFIIKTDVDKVLSSFKQVTSALQLANISAEDINIAFGEILDRDDKTGLLTSPIAAIMSAEHLKQLEAIDKQNDKDGKQRLAILEAVEKDYANQQKVLLQTQITLKDIQREQALYKNLVKESSLALKVNLDLVRETRRLTTEQLEFDRNRAATNLGITNERLKELAIIDDINDLSTQEDIKHKSIAQVLGAINKERQLQAQLLANEVAKATEVFELQKDIAEIELNRLQNREKLNSLLVQASSLEAKRQAFARTGSSSLNPAAQIKALKEAEKARLKEAKDKEALEKRISAMKFKIIAAELDVLKKRFQLEKTVWDNFVGPKSPAQQQVYDDIVSNISEITQNITDVGQASKDAADIIAQTFLNAGEDFAVKVLDVISKGIPGASAGGDAFKLFNIGETAREGTKEAPEGETPADKAKREAENMAIAVQMAEEQFLAMGNNINDLLGEDGVMLTAIANASAAFIDLGQNFQAAFADAGTTSEKVAAITAGIAGAINQVRELTAASAKQKTNEIDKMIEAEKKRDGKSKESLAKIAAMEKKKDQIKRKAFEQNKKLMLAQAVMSTANSVATALAGPPGLPWSAAIAAMAAALGMAQISIIKGMTYQGGGTAATSTPQSIQVGKRTPKVDVSQRATSGELAYLRGEKGMGTNANNFIPAAAGMRKSYASGTGEIMVGERGPEIIQAPATGFQVTPNDKMGGQNLNANITINAIDAAGVQEVLTEQRGNIIGMIREAAHEHGEEFIEAVNTSAYGSTSNTEGGYG